MSVDPFAAAIMASLKASGAATASPATHSVYRISFADGAAYVGITGGAVQDRTMV